LIPSRALLAALAIASAVAWTGPIAGPATADAALPAVDAAPQGVPVRERLAEIQRRVQAVLHYPESARARGVSGQARVGFEVRADGRADAVTLLESSGSAALDRAAQRAVREVEGLPPVLGRVAIPVRFDLRDGARPDSD
jgi:TonB family protein